MKTGRFGRFTRRRWRRRAAEGMSRAVVAATAGAGLGWLLEPSRGRARRVELLDRARRALRRLDARPGERAGGSARGARPAAEQGAPGPRARRAELLASATAAVLLARALLGRSLLRVPVAVAGAALVGAARRRDARRARGAPGGRAEALRKRAASRAATRAREDEGDRAAHVGGWHPEPEVVEVKSPAELEPGVASASPTSPSRVESDDEGPARRDPGDDRR